MAAPDGVAGSEAAMIVPLATAEYGAGPPLAILHGLFGSGRNWASMAQRLGAHHRVIALDLRNHGASPWADAMDYREMADDVQATMQARGYERFALLGHSLGGKVAMTAALENSVAVERLIVVDIAPVAYATRHLGHVRAMRQLDLASIKRRADADAALAPTIADTAERAFLLQNLILEDGGARWRLNLEAIEREMPHLAGFPPISVSRTYAGPSLFVAGGRSDYLRPEHEPVIRRMFPNAEIANIDNAGHWLHAEQPTAFLAVLEAFLNR
jgi:pimeloyl-ACP methyl ester carboxylesterase